MKKISLFFAVTVFIMQFQINAQEVAQWRGDNRDGKYKDTNLLKVWPEEGPELLWHYDNLGPGHASASGTKDAIYTSGTDEDGNGFVIALTHSGEKLWQTSIGKEWMDNFDGARSTPLYYDGKIYIMSSYGNLYCMNATDGSTIWNIDLFTAYDGINIKWGVTENLLIDGDKLFVTPGGEEDNVIALNKDTGKLIWKSKGKGEISAYCSPMLINKGDLKIMVTQTASSIMGLNAATGELLWSHPHPNKWSVQANTPIYNDGKLYCFSGYGKGGVQLQLSDDGMSITEVWTDPNLDSKMGGAILLDGKIYGSGDKNRKWFCIDWETGKELYSAAPLKVGNIIYADGMLYCYGDGGNIGLVDPNTNDFSLVSSFSVPYGEQYHWAHLVIHDKKLYVRHGISLMVYDISAD